MLAGLPAAARADVRTTPHNLGAIKRFSPSDDGKEVCVFCHTPSEAPEAAVAPPRWQPALPGGFVFNTYDDIGQLGMPGNTAVGSQSVACLSCHDAAQALSVTRLSLDHPFGIPYRGVQGVVADIARKRARERGLPMQEAAHLKGLDDFRAPFRATIDDRTVWWASPTNNAVRRGRGDLPLYSRLDAGGEEVPFVECTSCHDPHSDNKLFLRASPESGELCLTCHIK